MIPTFIGLILAGFGVLFLFTGRIQAMFRLMLLCSLMGGSAAVIMTALGGSSIQPVHFVLMFMVLRMFLPGSARRHDLSDAIRVNMFLILFAAYGVVMSFVGPRLFAGDMNVVPMSASGFRSIYGTVPLAVTSQNITAAVYLTGTALFAITVFVAVREKDGWRTMVTTMVVAAWIHAGLGVISVVFKGTAIDGVLQLFRNASYAQLDQQYHGLIRMSGIFPEPSAFAGLALIWFTFLFECWFRDVLPRRTGPAAAALAVVLIASTSSTAYLGLGGYMAVLILRMLILPQGLRPRKFIALAMTAVAVIILVSLALLAYPEFAAKFGDMLVTMTLKKGTSLSGIQRGIWARQGLAAFVVSGGLGVGPGSFRSSSIATAILGSMGAVGVVLFLCYLAVVLKPLRASTFAIKIDNATSVGVAAAWAATLAMIPASVAGSAPDPGADFAIMAGAALGLRFMKKSTPATRG